MTRLTHSGTGSRMSDTEQKSPGKHAARDDDQPAEVSAQESEARRGSPR